MYALRPTALNEALSASPLDGPTVARSVGLPDERALADVFSGRRAVDATLLEQLAEVLDQEVSFFLDEFASAPQLGARFAAGEHQQRPMSAEFVRDLHDALYRGLFTWRKLAQLTGMTLHELAALFPAYSLSDPAQA